MTIRVTGLNSGLDTDSIIKELVSAYRTKGDKLKSSRQKCPGHKINGKA